MADMEQRNMNVYTNQITKLKSEFVSLFQKDENAAVNILKKMRIIHGLAIYDDVVEKNEAERRGTNELNEDVLIRLSTNSSMLHVMHSHVRQCERLAYNHKRGIAMNSLLSSDETPIFKKLESFTKDKKYNPSLSGNLSSNSDTHNIFEPSGSHEQNTFKLNVPVAVDSQHTKIQKGSGCHAKPTTTTTDSFDTTEYINNLNTTEANKLVSEFENQQTNTKTNTSDKLLYYWANWCPFSLKFNETWKEFIKNANAKFPNLHIQSTDVGKDNKKVNEALQMGVSSYPTIVVIHNGKTYSKTPTNMSVEDLARYLKDILNSNQ